MTAPLNDEVAKLSPLFATLKQRLDRNSLEALGKQVLSLRQLLKEILTTLDVFKNDSELNETKLNVWAQLDSEVKLDKLKRVAEKVIIEESTDLSKFFANVSKAVIEAQKNLNESSKKYIDELEKTKSPVPPTYFAIPSLKAEMKLGVSELTSEGVNVVLYKTTEQQERYFESAVTFELVSTPPAPATRPKPEPTELAPPGMFVLPPGPPGPPAELEKPEREEEVSRIDELTLGLKEAQAAMLAVTESLLEVQPPEKPKARKPTRKAGKKRAARKASTKKSRSRKSTKKSNE